ncbi:MAG: hypothetical protein KGQ60_06640 [Planctomycetes bacterium]|nr:hypothetical protein [Planctomycetota bacterium]
MKRFRIWVPTVIATYCLVGCAPESTPKPAEIVNKAKEASQEIAQATGMSDLVKKATDSLASVEGGADMLKSITDSLGLITTTLGSVKDADSATAAVPELKKLTDTFGGMTDKFGGLTDAAKGAVSGIFTSALGDLKPIVDKLLAIPGVEAILKPTIDGLMEKLISFK